MNAALTTWVVTGSQKNPTSRLPDANDMTGGWRTENTVLSDDELLDTICRTDLCNQLNHFWVPISSITTNDKCRAIYALGDR
jgi:hypothetical protein